jgi:uncharacterized protein YegL
MSKKGLTEIVCILDRSGSMESIRDDAIGGFNSFIESQKKVPGTASVSLVLFDDLYENVYSNIDLNNVSLLNRDTFVPRGMTALLDAVGKTITDVGVRLSNMTEDERPEKVMVIILTDGQENHSSEYNKNQIKEMIEHQRSKYSWEFMFLGANQDAFANASSLGVNVNYTRCFAATADGVTKAYGDMSFLTTSYRNA